MSRGFLEQTTDKKLPRNRYQVCLCIELKWGNLHLRKDIGGRMLILDAAASVDVLSANDNDVYLA